MKNVLCDSMNGQGEPGKPALIRLNVTLEEEHLHWQKAHTRLFSMAQHRSNLLLCCAMTLEHFQSKTALPGKLLQNFLFQHPFNRIEQNAHRINFHLDHVAGHNAGYTGGRSGQDHIARQ